MKKNQIIRKHSDVMECREASAQHYERKLNSLLAASAKGKLKITPDEFHFQVAQLKGEIKKWREESARHAFQSGLKEEFVAVK